MIIRPWKWSDTDALRPMIADCLQTTYEAGADLMPTEKNAQMMIALGMAASFGGDPTLLAEEEGAIIGYVLWLGATNGFFDVRPNLCTGLGTYVIPARRLDGVSARLRSVALAIAKAKGYMVTGVAYDPAGLRSALAAGFEVVGQAVRIAP